MLFNSYEFIFVYLPIVFLLFFLLGRCEEKRFAIAWLVLSSFFFYGWWNFHDLFVLCTSIAVNYFIGRKIEQKRARGRWLFFGIALNLLVLFYYKYTGFFLTTLNEICGMPYFSVPNITLPLGISFFTFTQTAFLVDAYRGETRDTSFLVYMEFVTIFPHLIAGPIIHHREMFAQFLERKNFSLSGVNVWLGIVFFTSGLFKKVILADTLAPMVNTLFLKADHLTFIEAWFAAIGYTLELYFDFSGYSEMAIGLGYLFNLSFPINFLSPYKAMSIIDFWRRWHMTLGRWVKAYIYIPLGGNRQGEWKKMCNLLIAMVLIGIWHGAGWTFILWGIIHGVFLLLNHQWRRLKVSLPKFINWLITFSCVVCCWVVFRAESIHDALSVLYAMLDVSNFCLPTGRVEEKLGFLRDFGVQFADFWIVKEKFVESLLTLICCFLVAVGIDDSYQRIKKLGEKHSFFVAFCTGAIFTISVLTIKHSQSEFLYFQF